MKNKIRPILSMGTVLLSFMLTTLFPSCNDELPADSYYTFTGEMMSAGKPRSADTISSRKLRSRRLPKRERIYIR